MKISPDRRAICAGLGVTLLAPVTRAQDARLPDGEVTSSGGLRAWLTGPTTRYAHAVLGDAIEADGFRVERAGRTLDFRLGNDAVFEDRRVRLVDVDGDGRPEALVVKSYLDRGSALALYRIGVDAITPLAESVAIGTANRWLNPVGVGDFLGDNSRALAAVVTPHLAGSLRLYRLDATALREVARIDGYTNHIIGSRDLDLAHVIPGASAQPARIVSPTVDRRSIAMLGFVGGSLREMQRIALPGRAIAMAAPVGRQGRVTLESGKSFRFEIAG